MTHKLLAPLRVIESSAFIAAPLAGLTLAQFGADMIRVDLIGGGIDYGRLPRMPQPEGKGRSLYWTGLNKGKRAIAIDIRRPEDRELMRALVTAPGPEGWRAAHQHRNLLAGARLAGAAAARPDQLHHPGQRQRQHRGRLHGSLLHRLLVVRLQ